MVDTIPHTSILDLFLSPQNLVLSKKTQLHMYIFTSYCPPHTHITMMWAEELQQTTANGIKGFLTVWVFKVIVMTALEVFVYTTTLAMVLRLLILFAATMTSSTVEIRLLLVVLCVEGALMVWVMLAAFKKASRKCRKNLFENLRQELVHSPMVRQISREILAEISLFTDAVPPEEFIVRKVVSRVAVGLVLEIITVMHAQMVFRGIVHSATSGCQEELVVEHPPPRFKTMDCGG